MGILWKRTVSPVQRGAEYQLRNFFRCLKYRNFTQFPVVEILWKRTVSADRNSAQIETVRKLCAILRSVDF